MGSRIKNSLRNSFWGATSNLVMTLLNFIVRTIFIKVLGNQYLGINGLFTNILYFLSFAELGVGHAITYCMYKPVAKNNYDKINSLLKLYKKMYTIIGVSIFLMGILVIPFFPFIIKDMPNIPESLILIYILYLLETSLSYFFSYKKSIITVNQKDYVCDKVRLLLSVIKSVLQIIVLLLFKNYILYLIIYVLSTLLTNIILSIIANKKYPYIKQKNIKEIDEEEKKDIINNIKSLFLYNLGRVSLSGTDNIIISALIGITAVGLYSNYSLIISAVSGITYILLKGTISSVGNVNATENIEKKEEIMKTLLFISTWLYGFITICLIILLNPFIELWLGKEYLLSIITITSAVFYIFIDGIEFASHTYISTLGYFKETRYSSFICAIINIILSIILGKIWGYFGIFISTSISKLLTSSWYDTYVIYKNEFKKTPWSYYLKHITSILIVTINFLICFVTSQLITGNSISCFILKSSIVVLLSNIIFTIFYYKTKEFKTLWNKLFKEKFLWKKQN